MTDYNVAASTYGMFPNSYYNQVALNDLSNLDMYSSMGSMGMTNPMGMNGSMFSGTMGYGTMGYGAGTTGMSTMPMIGGMYGGFNEEYYKNYEKYQDFMVGNQVRQQQRVRNADMQINSTQEGVSIQAKVLREKIMRNEQVNILGAYNSYLDSVREMYGSGSDESVQNKAMMLYQQQFGTNLTDDIRQFGKCSMREGFESGVTLGALNDRTAEDNISAITGQPADRWENVNKTTGKALGFGTLGAGAFVIGSKFWTVCKGLWKSKILLVAAIGGALWLASSAISGSSEK
ncbi:MAG: hypothetical protein R3Y28_07420 [Candidatus Gastranaerophilales bacterium]